MFKKKIKAVLEKLKRIVFGSNYFLMYHRITKKDDLKSGCDMSFDLFCESIAKIGNFIDIKDALDFKCKNRNAITFDDGTDDIYHIVYPFLTERNIPFTVFVVVDWLDTKGYLTTQQLIEISKNSLVTIGSHGITHTDIKSLSYESQKNELVQSKLRIESIIGKKVEHFAYPHGQRDSTTHEILNSEKIYRYCFDASGGSATKFNDRFYMPRLRIDNKSYKNSMAIMGKG